ncbi:predicted protein [Histoplasma mississippiense (nom. inval.)]|uniref:predicted protein n=1 Tax=Ajellomyces capsulatus (strain NAm1 / WU24) TaxID=2059318 RepID=UPI000157C944|nr:predicted protein [Histoplasma mississippiense (nom. inval.)]EDN09659.1 predicted protein [Histoplasma mississippiense (nom. inval.)]
MSPASEKTKALRNYATLQKSKVDELQDLIENAGECSSSGYFNVLPSLSKIVKLWLENGTAITNLEELEKRALERYKELGKPDFECLHVALVRRQGQDFYSNSKCLGVLLDRYFDETDVNLIVWKGNHRCQETTTKDVMNWLFPEIRHIRRDDFEEHLCDEHDCKETDVKIVVTASSVAGWETDPRSARQDLSASMCSPVASAGWREWVARLRRGGAPEGRCNPPSLHGRISLELSPLSKCILGPNANLFPSQRKTKFSRIRNDLSDSLSISTSKGLLQY